MERDNSPREMVDDCHPAISAIDTLIPFTRSPIFICCFHIFCAYYIHRSDRKDSERVKANIKKISDRYGQSVKSAKESAYHVREYVHCPFLLLNDRGAAIAAAIRLP